MFLLLNLLSCLKKNLITKKQNCNIGKKNLIKVLTIKLYNKANVFD